MLNNHYIKESAKGFDTLGVAETLLSQRRIFLTEPVTETSCHVLIQQLMFLESESQTDEITMYINSPGGLLHDGLAVYDAMRMLKAPLRTVCIGTAASMGSILFLGADKREMLPHTRIMIHDPFYGSGNFSGMKPHELQQQVDELNKVREQTGLIIAERTGHTLEEIYEKTCKDSFFSAEEAIKFGLATGIADGLV